MKPVVSVIVPVFNKAAHLRLCLESLLDQTLGQIEILCVDDNSTDGSATIIQHYANIDRRVRVIQNINNLGPGPSRNIGIAHARGDFLQFTDADDILPANALDSLFEVARDDRVHLVRGNVAALVEHERWLASEHSMYPFAAIRRRSRFNFVDEPILWTPWFHVAWLIRRTLVVDNALKYPALRRGEDPVFIASLLVRAPIVSTTDALVYKYRVKAEADPITVSAAEDLIAHAAMVKRCFTGPYAKCWKRKYRQVVLCDLNYHLKSSNLSASELATLITAMSRVVNDNVFRSRLRLLKVISQRLIRRLIKS